LLKPDEGVADDWNASQFVRRIGDGVVFELNEARELLFVELLNTLTNILRENEVQESLKFAVIAGENFCFVRVRPFGSRNRRKRKRDVGQHVSRLLSKEHRRCS